jgi:hypothetical protein
VRHSPTHMAATTVPTTAAAVAAATAAVSVYGDRD